MDIEAPIVYRDRVYPIRAVIGEVFKREQAAESFGAADNLLSDITSVENLSAFIGDTPQGPGHPRIFENFTGLRGTAVNEIVDRPAFVAF